MSRVLQAEALAAIASCPIAVASAWVDPLEAAMQAQGVSTPARVAAFLAQVCHESRGLSELEENLRYSALRLAEVWPHHFTLDPAAFPALLDARAFGGDPERIADVVYADRMGNGGRASGDGWRYRGRGLIQLTGRTAYRHAGETLSLDLVEQPERLLEPALAAASAAWFWTSIDGNRLADLGTEQAFGELSRAINGGDLGLRERMDIWTRARSLLGGSS